VSAGELFDVATDEIFDPAGLTGHPFIIVDGDPIDPSEFELGPREILCPDCFLMHREGACDAG